MKGRSKRVVRKERKERYEGRKKRIIRQEWMKERENE